MSRWAVFAIDTFKIFAYEQIQKLASNVFLILFTFDAI